MGDEVNPEAMKRAAEMIRIHTLLVDALEVGEIEPSIDSGGALLDLAVDALLTVLRPVDVVQMTADYVGMAMQTGPAGPRVHAAPGPVPAGMTAVPVKIADLPPGIAEYVGRLFEALLPLTGGVIGANFACAVLAVAASLFKATGGKKEQLQALGSRFYDGSEVMTITQDNN